MRKNLFQLIRINRRKIFLSFIFLVVSVPASAFADSLIDRALASPINGLINVIKSLGFKTIDELIFYLPNSTTAPFTQSEWFLTMSWYHILEEATGVLAVVAVIVSGLRIMAASGNPSKRAEAMQKINLVVLAYATIWFLPIIAQLIFLANAHLTALFKSMLETYAPVYGAQGFGQATGWNFIDSIKTSNPLATAIVKLAFAGIMVYFNFLYTIRKFVLIAMIIVTPVAVWGWGITGYRRGLEIVIGEITSNAFMQASHALVFSLFAILIAPGMTSDFSNWWAQLFLMGVLIPTAATIRQLFMGFLRFLGVNEEGYAGMAMGGLAGLGAIASLAGQGIKGVAGTVGDLAGGIGKTGGVINKSNFGGGPGGFGGSDGGSTGFPIGQTPFGGQEVSVPGSGFTKILNTAAKASQNLSTVGRSTGSIVGTAMGLGLGASGMHTFSELGGLAGGIAGGSAGSTLGTIGSFTAQTVGYKYATDDPTKKYVDEEGNGLIKGVQTDDGSMKYYMPDTEGYDFITPIKTFATEIEAQKEGYKPAKKADFGDRIKNITGSEYTFDGAGKIIGATVSSPLGPMSTNIGGKIGEKTAGGIRKGYGMLKNFRWRD